jgi:hypothetical protein
MEKYVQKKLFGRMSCGLLIVTGSVSNMAYGSQDVAVPVAVPRQLTPQQITGQVFRAIAGKRIPNDPNGDTYYLQAVRIGDLGAVRHYLTDPHLDLSVVDVARNTDLMLVIKGGEQDAWGANYREIFNLIVQRKNRNWNLQNLRGQTALSSTVGWGREEAFKALLQIDAVDPDIPNIDRATPLLIAIANTLIPIELRVNMSLQLINHPRVNVNQRGTDNKLPLQVAFEAGFGEQLANAICRRSLVDYDVAVKNEARILMQQLVPDIQGEAFFKIQNLLVDPRVNVNSYEHYPVNLLVDAIRRKIHFLLNQLGINVSDLPGAFVNKLHIIDTNTQLFDNFLTRPNEGTFRQLLSQLQ